MVLDRVFQWLSTNSWGVLCGTERQTKNPCKPRGFQTFESQKKHQHQIRQCTETSGDSHILVSQGEKIRHGFLVFQGTDTSRQDITTHLANLMCFIHLNVISSRQKITICQTKKGMPPALPWLCQPRKSEPSYATWSTGPMLNSFLSSSSVVNVAVSHSNSSIEYVCV